MLHSKKSFFLIGILACFISQIAAGKIKRSHHKRGLSQQEQLDATYNQQMLEYEKFLKEQQTQLELAKAEQLRQLQDSQVQLFRQQQEHESFIANYQAGLNNEKVHQMNMNKPAGQSVAELKASMPEIAPDAALGGANSNSRRKIEHNEKINDQLRFEESKRQILAQQQLQVDAMNQQHQIQAETRADQQDAFITTKLEEEHMLAKQRDQLYDLIEAEVRSRLKKSDSEEGFGEARSQTGEPVEDLLQDKFARLLKAEERNKAFEETIAKRKEKYLQLEQERQLRRKEEQVRQAQKLQDILHDSQATQEDYEKRYQDQLEQAKQEQLRQSKVIQEQLHQTQRQLAAQEENMFGVQVLEAHEKAELSGDQQTRNQKLIIMKQQEQVRLAHKMQQNHRLTQDQDHENTKSDIALQQAKQSDHMDSQHFMQHNERVRQKIALESLRNQLKSQISQFKLATEPKIEQQPEAVVNPETVYLEPRFFLTETNQQGAVEPAEKMDVLPEIKTVTITETKKVLEPELPKERKLETPVNKTVDVNCNNKEDGMYRDENDCNAYYVCTNKQIYKFACPSGTSFSMEHCTCSWPTESTECVTPLVDNRCDKPAAQPKQEVVSSEESYIEDQLMSFSCKNKEKGFYRDPVDCTKFYYCEVFNKPAPLVGQTIIKNDFYCPNNFHFDVFTCKCGEQTANSCSNIALTTYCTHSS